MKQLNLFLLSAIVAIMFACVPKQKIGGTLQGNDVAESSEVQVKEQQTMVTDYKCLCQ